MIIMDVTRAHTIKLAEKVAGYCEVCGAGGNHAHADYDLALGSAWEAVLICDECILPILNAEAALVHAGCALPEVKS